MSLSELGVLEPLHLSEHHLVVLVDDEPQVLSALQRVLRDEPYEVRTTTEVRTALEWVRQGKVSLVVTDQRMPDMVGTEFIEQVRRISPRTLRVMLTAYPGTALVRYAMAEDVQWLIRKPWNDQAVRLAIRCMLHSLEPQSSANASPSPEAPGGRPPQETPSRASADRAPSPAPPVKTLRAAIAPLVEAWKRLVFRNRPTAPARKEDR